MKSILSVMLLPLSVLMLSSVSQAQDVIPIPDGPYLGQTPPGSTPEIFAPGIVNREESISPNGNTILFKNGYIERTSDGWSEVKSLGEPFASIDIMRSAISSNGTIYFDTFNRAQDIPLRYSRLLNDCFQAHNGYSLPTFVRPDKNLVSSEEHSLTSLYEKS